MLLDIVPNHTSIEHPWFRERPDFYVWADEIPNNWRRAFGGGPAWTLDAERGRYYFHNFAPGQPDLDWWNPEVRAEFERILRFWFDRGIAGFRIDVAHALVKDRELRDDVARDGGRPAERPAGRHRARQLDEPARDARGAPELAGARRDLRAAAGAARRGVRDGGRAAGGLLRHRRRRAEPRVRLRAPARRLEAAPMRAVVERIERQLRWAGRAAGLDAARTTTPGGSRRGGPAATSAGRGWHCCCC